MAFFKRNMLTILNTNSHFDEGEWVKQIRHTLDEELEEETTQVTIFGVPKALMSTNPDSYIPQQVAIGPYHHLRPELYDMERYKIAAARRNQRELQNTKLQDLVDHLMRLEIQVRASYHRPVAFGCEALAWLMAVDVSFLFEFLQVCGVKEGKVLTKNPSRVAHLVELSGNETAHNTIMRDIIMLENQIPLFVLRMLLECQFESLDLADEALRGMLTGLCKELSPFKMVDLSKQVEIKDCAHILDFLYHFIVPKEHTLPSSEIIEIHDFEESQAGLEPEPSHLRKLLDDLRRIILSPLMKWFKNDILTKIPIVKIIKEPIERIIAIFHEHKDGDDKKNDDKTEPGSGTKNKHPVREEISIPSVTQLVQVGIQFVPTNEGISSINFDHKSQTFYIPVMKLDVNTEVVLRNLVAYEACITSGPLVMTRYTELMNGIIDSDADAKFLCDQGIIDHCFKSEKEVADLWNGMSRSVSLTKVPPLDKVIRDVNKFYHGRWKVKLGKFMKNYVFGSWRILTFLAAIALLALTALQAFCQVYSCSRIFPIKALEPITTKE